MSRDLRSRQTVTSAVKSTQSTLMENSSEEEDGRGTSVKQEADNNISRSSSSSPTSDSHQIHQQNISVNIDQVAESLEATVICEEVSNVPTRNLPAVNVPEKIVLCIDTCEDPNYTPFKLENGNTFTPLYMIKRIVEIFTYSKSTMDKRHEFALAAMHGKGISWIRDFTSDPRVIIQEVEKLFSTLEPIAFDLTGLFNVLHKYIPLPEGVENASSDVPPFIPRVILIYNRSNCVPEFIRGKNSYNLLSSCLYFTLDILYIHEEPSNDNKCEEIYKKLVDLSQQGISYIFNNQRNASFLHDNMAKLLAHPLQRHPQEPASYTFEV